MKFLQASLVLCGLSFITSLPTKSEDESAALYAGHASQIIATNLLKSYNDIDANQVHSPLGVTTILAVLAEATQGDTYDEFYKVLGYPKERQALRDSFKSILSKYQTKALGGVPAFQTFLYIYRNFTVREEFKQIVRDNYFVIVKDINRGELNSQQINAFNQNPFLDLDETTNNSKDIIGFETLKRLKVDDDDDDVAHDLEATTVSSYTDNYGEEMIEKETSKFDRFVDDKQYMEKADITEEINKDQQEETQTENNAQFTSTLAESTSNGNEVTKQPAIVQAEKLENLAAKPVADAISMDSNKNDDAAAAAAALDSKDPIKRENNFNLEENETVQENEKVLKNYKEEDEEEKLELDAEDKVSIPIQEVLESNEPEKVSLRLQRLVTGSVKASKDSAAEFIWALRNNFLLGSTAFGGRNLFRKNDITSSLSANSITGSDVNSKTKMLLTNGLYFKVGWSHLFRDTQNVNEFFFITSEDAIKAQMVHARGKFHMAEMENLNAKIICLPYRNKKYTLMIILPNEVEGLHSVISKLQPQDLQMAKSAMKEQDLHVLLPKFQIEETSRFVPTLKSLGLTKVFSRNEADLSLLSEDNDLHVDDIAQYVNVQVNEGGSINNPASPTEAPLRDDEYELFEKFEINHPFAYFVMDCEKDFVLVSGKVHAPDFPEDWVEIDDDYE